MPDGFRVGFVNVGGHRLFYRSRGEPRKGTLLILHGGPGANHFMLLPLGDLAALGYRVVWYDQSGCGRSDRPRGPENYTMERRAGEADGVRRALELGPVHLFGHSFGAAIALQTALDHPEGLRSLHVGSGFASLPELERLSRQNFARAPRRIREPIERFERAGAFRDPRYTAARSAFDELPVRNEDGTEAVSSRGRVRRWEVVQALGGYNARIDRAFYGPTADALSLPVGGSMKGWDVTPRLSEIRLPTLVTVGRYDFVDPGLSRQIHRAIPRSKLVVFEQSGHGTLWDERDHFMDVVHTFLDRVRPAPN